MPVEVRTAAHPLRLHVEFLNRPSSRKHALGNESIQDAAPELSAGPTVEAVVDGRGRTVFGGTVLPAAASLQHMQEAVDDPSVIDPARTRLVLWKVRLDRRPRLVSSQKSLFILASVAKHRQGI